MLKAKIKYVRTADFGVSDNNVKTSRIDAFISDETGDLFKKLENDQVVYIISESEAEILKLLNSWLSGTVTIITKGEKNEYLWITSSKKRF